MLPSMPLLFSRDSRDAFGNKIEPSTSFFGKNTFLKPFSEPVPPPTPPPIKSPVKETKPKTTAKKKTAKEEEPLKLCTNDKNTAFVKIYYTKVQQRLASNPRVPNNKFLQFQELLRSFDYQKETPIDLYKKVERFFGEENKDLADEFLQFLTPGQAAQIGRFMDHNMMNRMTNFIQLLQSTFARKPAALRKILRAVAAAAQCATLADMRAKVLPLLRSHARLAHTFRALFPDHRPADSLYETGVDRVTESILADRKGFDVLELDELGEASRAPAGGNMDSVYQQGRVFIRHGRSLRPARVSYPYSKEPYRTHARRLAPAPPRATPSPPPQPKRTRRKPQTKDVNDNTAVKARKRTNRKKAKPKDKKVKWTREEDKTMLETLKGETVSDQVFVKIKDLLPHRSVSDIKERFFHVVNLLQQMAVGEVT